MNQAFIRPLVETLTITKQLPEELALNHESLYLKGIDYVRQYCGRVWTDYNVHDPGMTTLELLSFVLTDIAYRTSYPVADILATASETGDISGQFHSAASVFSNNALTVNDYRKLIIDIPDINNAWIVPVEQNLYVDKVGKTLLSVEPADREVEKLSIRGLYKLVLDIDDAITGPEKVAAEQAAMRRLMQHRNLCEDWLPVERVKKQNFFLCGGIELDSEVNADRVHAEILFTVQQYLTTGVKQHSLSEMQEKRKLDGSNYSTDEIFSGPILSNGFIADEDLAAAELRSEIRLSDIINLIMEIDGVARVRKLHISPSKISAEDPVTWLVPVKAGHKPRLKIEHSRLEFFVDNLPVVVSEQAVRNYHRVLIRQQSDSNINVQSSDLPIPKGRIRSMSDYHSLMNHFPAIYGVGELGLPAGATNSDKNKARQFKAYLLFVDQILANFTAQITHLASLLSNDPEVTQTYAFKLVDSFKEYEKIYGLPSQEDERESAIADFNTIFTTEKAELKRRNRFLDHLLARYGEHTSDFAAALIRSFDVRAQTLVRYKCRFLQNYPEISRSRGTAFNYTLSDDIEVWNSANVSGLEKRLAMLLGLENVLRRDLSKITLKSDVKISGNDTDGFRFDLLDGDGLVLISSPNKKFSSRDETKKAALQALLAATVSDSYFRDVNTAGKHFFQLIDQDKKISKRRAFNTERERDDAIDKTLEYVRTHYSQEGMFLIENILLRQHKSTDPLMPVCVDSNCDDCSDIDPYSYRLHLILPAYAERFQDMDFRLYVENVIRREMPAHILPKICWANREDIALLEQALFKWHQLLSGQINTGRKQIMTALIDQLFATKSIFPTEKLVDCDDPDNTFRFVLGRTTLGTLNVQQD